MRLESRPLDRTDRGAPSALPRSEELIGYLAARIPDDELVALIDRLKVDLTPADISTEFGSA